MGGKITLSKKHVYGLIAILFVVCLSLSIFFSLQLNVNAAVRDQPDAPEAATTPNQTPIPTNQTTLISTNTPAPSTQNSSELTEDQALSIAMPYINQYATENNRTITTVSKTFVENSDYGPAWFIEAMFEKVDNGYISGNITNSNEVDPRHWIIGYEIVVLNNGQVVNCQVVGII